MLVSLEWLGDFLDLNQVDGHELAELMSRTGIEIEGVTNYGQGLSNLVVGQVLSLEAHPDSDHLQVAQVDIGSGQSQTIVCGAPNIAQGQKVMVALPGAKLPGGINIGVSKLRGVESKGMICSLGELGFPEAVVPKAYAKGIYVLDDQAPVGADLIDYLHLDDPILELDITPNRADALSMLGAAYEVGAIIDQRPMLTVLEDIPLVTESDKLKDIQLDIDSDLSQAYQVHLIEGVQVVESPTWLQVRLMKAGIRPLNNIVDATNYYLLQYGQPLHAFDYDRLDSKMIAVAPAQAGETIQTLDGLDRTLEAGDVLIKSGSTPIALAGVMGGLDSEVSDSTKNVLLEAAVFNPRSIRKTSKRLGLRSEASARFEKGINPASLTQAGQEAAGLMAILGQGHQVARYLEDNRLDLSPVKIQLSYQDVQSKLGLDLDQDQLQDIFDRLNFEVDFHNQDFTVSVPPRRWDISIPADILEEIARIYGYDKIPTSLPSGETTPGHLTQAQSFVRHSRALLEGMGLNQVLTYGLTSKDKASHIQNPNYDFVELDWPMSEERTVLRQSMFPALMDVAMYNAARKNDGLAFYEIGRVFLSQDKHQQPLEIERLSVLLSGSKEAGDWLHEEAKYDFFDLKGILETYLEEIRLADRVSFEAKSDLSAMHPGRTASIVLDDQEIGFLGQVHPKMAREYDLDDATFFMELDIDPLLAGQPGPVIQAPIPKYPATRRDMALLVNRDQSNASLEAIIKDQAGDDLVSVSLFDRYVGDRIDDDKQSLGYRLVFQNPDKTLTDQEVDAAMTAVEKGLLAVEGLEIR